MKLVAATVLFSALVAANPLPNPPTLLAHTLMRRDGIDLGAYVPEPCKAICRVQNGLWTEWAALNCNKEVTDACNKLGCKSGEHQQRARKTKADDVVWGGEAANKQYVDPSLACSECQLREWGNDSVVTQADIDHDKNEARKQCQDFGYPTHP